MFADLHLHTCFSDGTYTPEELAAQGKQHGLAAMALTDHDTVEGCARMAAACERLGIEFIPGTELTAEEGNVEVHLLGYFVDITHGPFLAEMTRFQLARQQRIHEMVARINQLNIPLTTEAVFKIANCQSPGRPHVGRALVQGGFCRSMEEAFDRLLKQGRPAYVPKTRMEAKQAIALIHGAGGLAVLAHPVLNRTDDVIPKLADAGLDGLECFHTRHSPSDTKFYLKMATRFQLLVTGGSDCHGMSKGKPLIGSVKVAYEFVERLKEKKFRGAIPPAAV